jgi:large subunit ribosomal protein L17
VTHAKEGTNASISQVSSFLVNKKIADKLIKEIAPRFTDRMGGYILIRRIGKRIGDGAEEVFMEWSVKEEKKPEKNKLSVREEKKPEKKTGEKTKKDEPKVKTDKKKAVKKEKKEAEK